MIEAPHSHPPTKAHQAKQVFLAAAAAILLALLFESWSILERLCEQGVGRPPCLSAATLER